MSADEPTAPPHDLWTSDGRYFLLPVGVQLPEGDLVVSDLSGAERRLDPEVATAFEITREEAEQFLSESVRDISKKVADVLAGFGDVLRESVNPGRTAVSGGDPSAEMVQGLIQLAMGMARGDPTAIERLKPAARRAADRARAGDPELSEVLASFPDRLAEELRKRRGES